MTIIAVGGAVNTIYLQSRVATHDVDFFNNNMTADDFGYLLNGAKEAAKRDSLLREQWFNNRTIFFIPMDQRAALTEQAFHQNEVIFRAQGLTVLAAPWQYALCCKLDRLAGSGLKNERRYDLNDAVQYLSRYLLKYHVAQVQKSELQAWFAQYSLRWTSASDAVIERLNAAYQAQFSVSDCPIV